VTIVADLTSDEDLEPELFDCVVATQTLHFIYDVHAVVRTLHRILKPGGVALVTVPGISKISPEDMKRWGQYWTFTSLSARRLFEEAFSRDGIRVEAGGNVLAATAFLMGIAAEELTEAELDHVDKYYETLVGVRAQKVAPR
jgi:SAM-dependent methyltransferase